jgi:hypothetical protein
MIRLMTALLILDAIEATRQQSRDATHVILTRQGAGKFALRPDTRGTTRSTHRHSSQPRQRKAGQYRY